MNTLISEINGQLKAILLELEQKKSDCENTLNSVKSKIDEKIDEAKKYKIDVDNAKTKIKSLESDISALEIDLNDLNERFGKTDLNAIVEAGNREINAKIISKTNEITKYREKIGELTEKARAIKDLLINLKKDKETKQARLDNYTKVLKYYEKELNKIIDFAAENPNTLELEPDYSPAKYDNTPIEDSPVFDEISKIDEAMDADDDGLSLSRKYDEEITEEPKVTKLDFKALNDSIDSEYANIFGSSDDLKIEEINEPTAPTVLEEPKNIFEQNDLAEQEVPTIAEVTVAPKEEVFKPIITQEEDHSGLTETDIFGNTFKLAESKEDDSKIVNLFTSLGIDYYSFNIKDQDYLKKIFNSEMITKIVDVLKRNNIDLNSVYQAANIFGDMAPAELEHVISKLLLAGQTTQNIGYVLGTLPLINSFDLNEVITSYGPLIKDANITDLIIKAKHLNDMGGNK